MGKIAVLVILLMPVFGYVGFLGGRVIHHSIRVWIGSSEAEAEPIHKQKVKFMQFDKSIPMTSYCVYAETKRH